MRMNECEIGVVCRFNAKLGGVPRDLLVREDLGHGDAKEVSIYGVPSDKAFDQFDRLVQHLIASRQLYMLTRRCPSSSKPNFDGECATRTIYSRRSDGLLAPYTKRESQIILLQPKIWKVRIVIDGTIGQEEITVRAGVERTIERARYECERLALTETEDGLEWMPTEEKATLEQFEQVLSKTNINNIFLRDNVIGLHELFADHRHHMALRGNLRKLVN